MLSECLMSAWRERPTAEEGGRGNSFRFEGKPCLLHINQVLMKSCILPLKFPRFWEEQLLALPSINCPFVALDENVVTSNREILLTDNSISLTRFLFRARISLSRPGHRLAWNSLCSSSFQQRVQDNPPASAWEGLQVCSTIPTSSARFHARTNHWNPKSVSVQ